MRKSQRMLRAEEAEKISIENKPFAEVRRQEMLIWGTWRAINKAIINGQGYCLVDLYKNEHDRLIFYFEGMGYVYSSQRHLRPSLNWGKRDIERANESNQYYEGANKPYIKPTIWDRLKFW